MALAWGLLHNSGTSASLMLTLEGLFTAVLAWRLYRETMDARVWIAMPLLLAGGIVLVFDQGRRGDTQLWGLLAVLLATAAWGVDNTLSRAVAERDPGQVVLAKASLGAAATTLLAVVLGEPLPRLGAALALFTIGASGYGLSRTHRLGVRLRALHRCCGGRRDGRPLSQRADGAGQWLDVGRRRSAPGGVAWP